MTTNPFDFDVYKIIDQASKTTREVMETQASFFREMMETQAAIALDMSENFKRMFSGQTAG